MIKLTNYEKDILNGKYGNPKKLALKGIIKYAEILGVEELVEITKAHMCCGSHAIPSDFPDGNLDDDEYLKKNFNKTHIVDKIPDLNGEDLDSFYETTFLIDDVHCCDSYQWEYTQQTKEFYENNKNILREASEKGVIIGSTCAPYLAGWLPLMGEYFVTTESSNVLFCNSILGARGNGGGGTTTLLSAICGRAPKWGLHLPEKRKGTHVFNIESKLETKLEWDMLGFAIGKRLDPNAIPVLRGNFKRPDVIKLKTFFTSLATASGCEMCLIVGVSPEALTYEAAMGGRKPLKEFNITGEMIDAQRIELCHPISGKVDFLQIGCPNASIEEIHQIAQYMKGKHVKEGVRFCVFTNIAQYEIARHSYLTDMLRDSGVELLTSGCILRTINVSKGAKGIGLSAGKLAHYSRTERDVPVYYGTEKDVMDASITGYWNVEK